MGKTLLFTQSKTQSYCSLSCNCLTDLFFFSFFTTFSKWQFFKGKDLTSLCYFNLNQEIIYIKILKKKIINQDTNNCLTLFFAEYQCIMLINHCRDEGPKDIYWVVGFVRGRLIVRGQINDSEDVRIRTPRTSYD